MRDNPAIIELKKLMGKYGIAKTDLSLGINVIPTRVYEILSGKRRITPDSDLRLCKFFEKENGHFLNMQTTYDLSLTFEKISDKLEGIKTYKDIKN